jgi:hypothetical protein
MMTLITILLVRVIEAGKSLVEAKRGIPRRYSRPAAGRGVPTTAWQPARVEGGNRNRREVDGYGKSAGGRSRSWRAPADGRHSWLGVALAEQVGTDPQEHGGVDQCHTELRPRRPQVRVVLADGH